MSARIAGVCVVAGLLATCATDGETRGVEARVEEAEEALLSPEREQEFEAYGEGYADGYDRGLEEGLRREVGSAAPGQPAPQPPAGYECKEVGHVEVCASTE